MTWDGKNQSGQRVANGVYFGIMEGNSEQKVFKITYLKKSN
jgi:flagellar hook assembly protein FlgD